MDKIKIMEYLHIPLWIIIAIAGLLLILNIIGSILDFKGKVWPEIVNFRGRCRRKKEEKEQQKKLLERLAEKLESFEQHYNPDNIAKRNEWMEWVNNRAEVYDGALEKLLLLQDKLNENNEMTLDLYINVNRNRILDFARIVADDNAFVSREEFTRIYNINKEYHATLDKYGRENGEVDTAMKLINEAYDHRMRNRCFIEDIRGYTKR